MLTSIITYSAFAKTSIDYNLRSSFLMNLCLLSRYLCRLSVAESDARSLSAVHFNLSCSLRASTCRLSSSLSHVTTSVKRRRGSVSRVVSVPRYVRTTEATARSIAGCLSTLSVVESLN
jgi:hypothetical protein